MKHNKISRRDFLKGTMGIILGGGLVTRVLESDARADTTNLNGWLVVNNYVNSIIGTNPLEIWHENGAGVSDGYDASYDVSFLDPVLNRCGIYSDIVTNKLRRDRRPTSSTLDFLIKLVYKGNPISAVSNHLQFSLPYGTDWEFDNKPILFQSDLLPFGPVVDVRRAIAKNGGIVPLKDLPAGSYSPSTPYGSGILTIGTRLLADLDDAIKVDFKDHSILAKDWQKSQGQYIGDIAGPNGIPDGNVDGRDLGAFSDSWLADVNDPNSW